MKKRHRIKLITALALSILILLATGTYLFSTSKITGFVIGEGVGNQVVVDGVPSYVDLDGKTKPRKSDGSACLENYECLSNLCSKGVCVDLHKEIEKRGELIDKVGKEEIPKIPDSTTPQLIEGELICVDSDSDFGSPQEQSLSEGFTTVWYNECNSFSGSGIKGCDFLISAHDVCKDSTTLYEMTCASDSLEKIEINCNSVCTQGKCT